MDSAITCTRRPIPTVNYHLLLACNMTCGHCFAANLSKPYLAPSEAVRIVEMLSHAGFEKINFAGGEPMLYPGLDNVIRAAKEYGMTTSMVTNGTRITDSWLDEIAEHLDWIALSIDSPHTETHMVSGRVDKNGPISPERYLEMCSAIKRRGIRLKINTVVTIHNHGEVMAGFVSDARPERWKIMRALPIIGQNDDGAGSFEITDEQFAAYLKRNRQVNGVTIVPEDNDQMLGSYMMIDPRGRFFDNIKGRYTYSQPILQVGIRDALKNVTTDHAKFTNRGGYYDW